MNLKKINTPYKKPVVLIAPLDWGLGHATRCIPLINQFLAKGCDVIVAAEKATAALLKHEFQQLKIIPLHGYRVSYSKNNRWLPLKLFSQVPSILLSIYKEHAWLKKVVKKHAIDAVISDNRFGLYHAAVPCIYITHQLLIKTVNPFTENIISKIHRLFIKKYTACWIPDFEGGDNIAGALSHPLQLPANVIYLGGLSRFKKRGEVEKKYDLLVLISGPEPQRAIFENYLLSELKYFNGTVLLVRGLPATPESDENASVSKNRNARLFIKNHLSSNELNIAIQQADLLISRSGYTTVMDLMKLGKKAILVPTPGQTEQEYLAGHLMKQHFFYTAPQENFSLRDALNKADKFPFAFPGFNMEQYKKVIDKFVTSLSYNL